MMPLFQSVRFSSSSPPLQLFAGSESASNFPWLLGAVVVLTDCWDNQIWPDRPFYCDVPSIWAKDRMRSPEFLQHPVGEYETQSMYAKDTFGQNRGHIGNVPRKYASTNRPRHCDLVAAWWDSGHDTHSLSVLAYETSS